jgi:predicted Zn-dependent protease
MVPSISRIYAVATLFFLFSAVSCAVQRRAERTFTPSVSTEKDLGREFHMQAMREFPFVKSPEVIESINRIGKRITKAAGHHPYTFRFYVINNLHINAFAVPGGYIYIHSGLISRTKSSSELAGVIAHEIVHVKNRHMAQQVGKGTLINLAALAALFLSMGDPAVATSAAAINQTFQLKYSRDFERDADRFGAFYLYRAGYDARDMVAFFNLLLKEQLIYPMEIPEYLSTHPMTEDRISALDSLIHSQRLFRKGASPKKDNYHRVRALVRAETGRREEVLRLYRNNVKDDPDNAVHYHDLALVYRSYGWFKDAVKALQKAIELAPADVESFSELAGIYTQMDRFAEASTLLEKAVDINPQSPMVYDRKGDLLFELGRLDEAIAAYKNALDLDPFLTHIHKRLSLVYSKKGERGEFHYQKGLYYREMGEDDRAIYHLEAARNVFGPSSPRGISIQYEIEAIKAS